MKTSNRAEHKVVQGTQEWLDLRKLYIGASEVAMVLEISPFVNKKYDQRVYLVALKEGLTSIFVNNAMRAGTSNEDRVRTAAEEQLFERFPTTPIFSKGNLLASLDGITEDEKTLLEIKYSKSSFKAVQGQNVPMHYMMQVQQQLYISGCDKGYFAAMNPETDELAIIEIHADDYLIAQIREATDKFIAEYDDLHEQAKLIFPQDGTDGETPDTIVTIEASEAIEKYIALDVELKAIQAKMKDLKALIPDKDISYQNFKKFPTSKKTVDYKGVIADQKIKYDEEKYTKVSHSFTVKVKHDK